jgi:hypothetical protein
MSFHKMWSVISDKGLKHAELTSSNLPEDSNRIIAGIEIVRDIIK